MSTLFTRCQKRFRNQCWEEIGHFLKARSCGSLERYRSAQWHLIQQSAARSIHPVWNIFFLFMSESPSTLKLFVNQHPRQPPNNPAPPHPSTPPRAPYTAPNYPHAAASTETSHRPPCRSRPSIH